MMTIDAQCKSCQKRYRVNESLAGRVAECKHCGAKFRIPYRSAVVRLDEAEEAAPAPVAPAVRPSPAPSAVRTFEEYAPLVPKPKKSKLDEPTANNISPLPLPAIVTDLWLPIAIMVLCYGLALFVSVSAVLKSHGVGAGFIMIGLVVASLVIVIIPLTVKGIDSASGTFDFRLSNALWAQAAAIVSVPVLSGTIGLIAGGVTGTILGTGIGVVLAIPLTMLLLQISIASGLQTGVLASLFFLFGTGGTVVVVWIVASVMFPIWYLNLPWGEAPVTSSNAIAAATAETAPAHVSTPPAVTAAPPVESATVPAVGETAAEAMESSDAVSAAVAAPAMPTAPAVVAAAVVPSAEPVQAISAVTVAGSTAAGARPVDELLPPAATPAPALLPQPPSPPPAATPEIAAQKQWVVTILSIQRADTSAINAELEDIGRMMAPARGEAEHLRERARSMDSDVYIVTERNARGVEGYRQVKKHRHSKTERGKAAAAAMRAENEVKRMQVRIAQLERERVELEGAMIISGQLDDGTLVEIEAGPREARFAAQLEPGSQWTVEGGARIAVGVLHVRPRLIQPLKVDPQAATPTP